MVELLKEFDATTQQEGAGYYRHLLTRIAPPSPRSEEEQRQQAVTETIINALQ